jgi:hypothetical protein
MIDCWWNPWPVFVSDQPSIFTQSDSKEPHNHLNSIFKSSDSLIQSVKIIHALTEHSQLTHLLANYSCSNVQFDKKKVEFYFILDKSFGNVSTNTCTIYPLLRIHFHTEYLNVDGLFIIFLANPFGGRRGKVQELSVATTE